MNTLGVSLVSTGANSFTVRTGSFLATYAPEAGELRLRRHQGGEGYLSIAPGRESSNLAVLDPEFVERVTVTEGERAGDRVTTTIEGDEAEDGVRATIAGKLPWAAYEFVVSFSSPGTVTYALSVDPNENDDSAWTALSDSTAELSFRTEGGAIVEDGVTSYLEGTPDSDPAAGTDDLNQFAFCAANGALDATILYLTDFTALSPY